MHYPHLTDLQTETPRGAQPAKGICVIRGEGEEEQGRGKKEKGKRERRREQALGGTTGEKAGRKRSPLW